MARTERPADGTAAYLLSHICVVPYCHCPFLCKYCFSLNISINSVFE